MNKNFGITMADYEAAREYADYWRKWVNTVCAEQQYEAGKPGASWPVPAGTLTYEERVLEYLNGTDERPVFDTQYAERARETAERIGLKTHGGTGEGHWPFSLYVEDPDVHTWNKARMVFWFWPSGQFYAAHGSWKHWTGHWNKAINALPYNANLMLESAITRMEINRQIELDSRELEIRITNERRAKLGVAPITTPWVDSVLNR